MADAKLVALLFILNFYSAQTYDVLPFGYHLRVGVPRAQTLLKLESQEQTRIIGGSQEQTRIIGGSQVSTADAIPHQVGIIAQLTTGWTSICGGGLISNTRVLTAAHCWWDGQSQARLFTIVLGSLTIFTGGTRIDTSDVTVHSSWNTQSITNDIAMVKITSVTFSNSIQAIPLPSISDVNQDFAGLTAIVSGYGKTSDAQNSFPTTTSLYQTSVNVITNTVCQASFDISLHGSHLCTSGQGIVGSCDGDSGGPLTVVTNNIRTLVGIVSFGLSVGCESGTPSVYTRVTAYLSWIQANM